MVDYPSSSRAMLVIFRNFATTKALVDYCSEEVGCIWIVTATEEESTVASSGAATITALQLEEPVGNSFK